MTIQGIFDSIRNHLFWYKVARKFFRFFEKRRSDLQVYSTKYIYDNRQSGSENMLMVIMGFQPYYWDVLLNRIRRNVSQFSETIDVCLCVPRGANEYQGGVVRRFAEQYNFSYLYIYEDLLAQVQNTAIKLHPNARWIFKIDEDIILSNNYFAKMKYAYEVADKDKVCEVGYVSPILNINDFSSKIFIETIGMMPEYESLFGRYSISNKGNKIFKDSEVAKWLWAKSIPFDAVAARVDSLNKGDIAISNIRVRIGAILLTRDFVERMGMFAVHGNGVLGGEELELCAYCMNYMYKIVVAKGVFCGHLGFSHQKESCRQFFEEHINEIK